MVLEYIMVATKISDGAYVYWPSIGAADPTATYAPISSSLLNLPATVDYTITSPTAGAGGIVFTIAGGDLSGTYPDPEVVSIRGISIDSTAPSDQQVLTYLTADGYLAFRNKSGNASVTPASSNYLAIASDYMIAVDTSSMAITIQLEASPEIGKIIQVKDENGNAATHHITVDGNGNTIDGSSTITLDFAYESVSIIFVGSQWSIV